MEKKEDKRVQIKRWLEENKNNLSLNADSWNCEVKEVHSMGIKTVCLGKYSSKDFFSEGLYKRISRIIKL